MRIPFDCAQVWFASMYFEPSTMYTRCLFRLCRQAWLEGTEPSVFLRELDDNLDFRFQYTEHYTRHGPYTLGLVPFCNPEDEIVEV